MMRRQYQAVLLSVVTVLASSAGQAAAELRCTDHSSPGERLICADETLQRLDTRLNDVYAMTAKYVPDKKALIAEQRAWLRSTRDTCTDRFNMHDTLNTRMRELSELRLRHAPVKVDEISDVEALGACEDIAKLAEQERLSELALYGQRFDYPPTVDDAIAGPWGLSQASLDRLERELNSSFSPDEVFLLRIDGGAPVRFSMINRGGSCSSVQVFNISMALAGDDGLDGVNVAQDELRWETYGKTQYPIYFKGRNFIITASVPDLNAINMVSVIRPNGRIRPICLAKMKKRWGKPFMGRDSAVCKAIAERAINPLKWKKITASLPVSRASPTYGEEFIRRYRQYAEEVSILRVDIDGDGKAEHLGRFEYHPGTGCGYIDTWLQGMAEDNSRVVSTALDGAFEKIRRGSLNVFDHGGRRYIETIDDRVRDTVVTIRDKQVQPVCAFRRELQIRQLFRM